MSAMTVDRKVMAGGVGGAAALIICWIIESFTHQPVPVYIALAFQTLAVFVLQFAVPNKEITNASQNPPASG